MIPPRGLGAGPARIQRPKQGALVDEGVQRDAPSLQRRKWCPSCSVLAVGSEPSRQAVARCSPQMGARVVPPWEAWSETGTTVVTFALQHRPPKLVQDGRNCSGVLSSRWPANSCNLCGQPGAFRHHSQRSSKPFRCRSRNSSKSLGAIRIAFEMRMWGNSPRSQSA